MRILFVILSFPLHLLSNHLDQDSDGLSLSGIFSDGMVLQADVSFSIFGSIDRPDCKVRIEFLYFKLETFSKRDSSWTIKVPSLKSGLDFDLLVISENDTIALEDIITGDVWLCAGQSNMNTQLGVTEGFISELFKPNNSAVRYAKINTQYRIIPKIEFSKNEYVWIKNNQDMRHRISALAYYFGTELIKHQETPIGLINCAVDGSMIQSWIPSDNLFDRSINYDLLVDYKWAGGVIYNDVIPALSTLPIKGIIWYQGEQNATFGDTLNYSKHIKILVHSWRQLWDDPDLPFISVQLHRVGNQVHSMDKGNWPSIRQSQKSILSEKKTALVSAIDNRYTSIHPKDKRRLGKRVALAARNIVYEEKVFFGYPEVDKCIFEEDSVKLTIKNNGDTLIVDNPYGYIYGFSIANNKSNYQWARGYLQNDTIVIYNSRIKNPSKVRYGWSRNPGRLNIYGENDIPLFPYIFEEQLEENLKFDIEIVEKEIKATLSKKIQCENPYGYLTGFSFQLNDENIILAQATLLTPNAIVISLPSNISLNKLVFNSENANFTFSNSKKLQDFEYIID